MIYPQITLIEMEDGTCKVKKEHEGKTEYLHVSFSQWEMLQGCLQFNKDKKIERFYAFDFLSREERMFMNKALTPVEVERKHNDKYIGSSSFQN